MAKFLFRLEQVLQQRIKAEEQALLEQAKAQQECTKYEQELAISKTKLEEAFIAARTYTKPDEQFHFLMYKDQLQSQIEQQTRLLQRAKEILKLRIRDTMKARQEKLVLEKLKEKQYLEYQELQSLLEQKEIDELATVSYAREKY